MKYFLLRLCTAVILFVISADVFATDTTATARQGILDLRSQNFDAPVKLDGEWKFAWKQLLSPNDTVSYKDFISFPKLWNNTVLHNQPLDATGYATYHLTILLPHTDRHFALQVPDAYSSYRLYVNGSLFSNNGVPDSVPNNYSPHWIPYTLPLFTSADTLQLTLQIANFSHSKGGPYKSILIGDEDYMLHKKLKTIARDFVLTGCLFMGGLFFLGLFFFGRRDKAILFFALFCMLYSYRIIGTNAYVLHRVFPDLSWGFTIRMEYFSLFGSVFVFLQYVRNLYPEDVYKPLMKVFNLLCLSVIATPFLLPSKWFTLVINPFLFIMFFCLAYVFFIFLRAWINKRLAAGYALISVVVLVIVMLSINLEYFGLFRSPRMIIYSGYAIFFFLQTLILSFRFAFSMNNARQQAEEGLKAKSEFLSNMSHEIRTPLNSVIGMSHLLLSNQPRPDQKEQLENLHFAAGNLLSIVNNILDYSKIEAGKISFEIIEMDIAKILRSIVSGSKTAADKKGLELNLILPPGLPAKVNGDPTRFVQVMRNLVDNAIKFTNHGSVRVTVSVVAKNETEAAIHFSIIDTGIGISKQKQALIFERFTQADSSTSRSFGGTGLGLAISARILELQQSALQVKSEDGHGAEFYFTQVFQLPLQATTEEEKPKPVVNANHEKPLTGMHVLLVEDNPMNVFVAKSFLERWGAVIDIAVNGQEALDKLDIAKHQLILMDLQMPVMDGYEATRQIRNMGYSIPVIALTATMPNEIEEEAKGLSFNNMVLKPFVPDDLFKAVTEAVVSQ